MEEIFNGSQLNQNIFLDDKDDQNKNVQKKKSVSSYSSTKIKARNMLTNLSYNRFNDSDFQKRSFIINVATFIVQYLNLFSLDRKLETENERKQVRFVWNNCLPQEFDEFLKMQDNYIFVSTQTLNFQKCYNIVQKFIENNEGNFSLLQASIKNNFAEIRYVFAVLFTKIFCRINTTGIKIKSKFDYSYFNWEKDQESKAKNMVNYANASVIRHTNEQKPIKIEIADDNDSDDKDKTDGSISKIKTTVIDESTVPLDKTEDILSTSYQMANLEPKKKVSRSKSVKERFDSDRKKSREMKREARKKQLECELEETNRKLAMIKPVTSKKKLIIK